MRTFIFADSQNQLLCFRFSLLKDTKYLHYKKRKIWTKWTVYSFSWRKRVVSNISILAIFLKPSLLKSRSIISQIIFGKFKNGTYFRRWTKSKVFAGIYFRRLVIFGFFAEKILADLAKLRRIRVKKFTQRFIPLRYLYMS